MADINKYSREVPRIARNKRIYTGDSYSAMLGTGGGTAAITTDEVPEGTLYDRLYVNTLQRGILQVLDDTNVKVNDYLVYTSSGWKLVTSTYATFTDDIPDSILPLPPTGKVYFGTTNGRLWKLLPSGAITYLQKEVTLNNYYTASATISSIVLAYLIGAVGIQITRGTQPLKDTEFTFTSSTGTIVLVEALQIYETIFITYQKNIDL